MTPREYILYRRNTLQLAMAGIGALVICFVSLAVYAEPALKQYALETQESHAPWK
jgi:hypothetical protein